ncbi:MAG TPA: hypothetical protein VFI72_01580, partial [Candidatus Angelobacter sp.]|nr:hypothetical protein [Candidatus Angelobacter sp.]
TGFKSDIPQRRERERTVSVTQQAIASARTASAYQPPQPAPPVAPRPNGSATYGSGSAPVSNGSNGYSNGNGSAARMVAAPAREHPTLATVTESIKTAVEADDLDVPAFIRKRGEIN